MKKRATLSAELFCKEASGERCRATVRGAPQPQASLRAPRGWRPLRRLGGSALRQHTPARDWPTLQSFSADTSGQQLAPSLLPPPSPRAWQEKRATWSGNKGPRGPRRSGTRCHSTPGPEYRCSLGPAPRPHAPGPGRSHRGVQTWATPHTRRRFLTAGTEIPASSFRQVIPAPRGSPSDSVSFLPPGSLCPSALRDSRHMPAAANATQLAWQCPERRARAALAPRSQRAAAAWGCLPPGTRTRIYATHPLRGRPRHPSCRIPAAPSSSSTVSGTSTYYLVHL